MVIFDYNDNDNDYDNGKYNDNDNYLERIRKQMAETESITEPLTTAFYDDITRDPYDELSNTTQVQRIFFSSPKS